jgi:hypothetical protein
MARPKLNRAQVQLLRDLYTHERATPASLMEAFNEGKPDTERVTLQTVEKVLHGQGDKAYVPLEDYLEKQKVICTRCGKLVHPTEAVYMDHAHKFKASTYHCEACAAICLKPKRKRPSRAKAHTGTLRRDFVKLYVDGTIMLNHSGLRGSELAAKAVTLTRAALKLWRKDRQRLSSMSLEEIRNELFVPSIQPAPRPSGPVEVAKTPIVYRRTEAGLERVRVAPGKWQQSISNMAAAYVKEFAHENPNPAELVFVRRIKLDGQWIDDVSEPVPFEEETVAKKIQKVQGPLGAIKMPTGRWILVLPKAVDHAWSEEGSRWIHHHLGNSREGKVSTFETEVAAQNYAVEFLLEKAGEARAN